MSKKAPTGYENMDDARLAREVDEMRQAVGRFNRQLLLARREQKRRQKEKGEAK